MAIVPAMKGPRKGKTAGITAVGKTLHRRTSRIAERQELGDLVESFAESIVDGRAVADISSDTVHGKELSMAARNQKQKVRRPQSFR